MSQIDPPPENSKPEKTEPPPIGTAAWLAWSREQRAKALADQTAAARAAALATAAATDRTGASAAAALAASQARPEARAPTSRQVMDALPAPALEAATGRVRHPKVWAGDLRGLGPPPDLRTWETDVASRARARVLGDPLASMIRAVAAAIAGHVRWRKGFARVTFGSLAFAADCCRETARKVVRWLERRDMLDTVNVTTRDGDGLIVRDANLYRPVAVENGVAEAPCRPPRAARMAAWARSWGLTLRDGGFNAFGPSRRRRRRPPPD
jgi:hypothetical protein